MNFLSMFYLFPRSIQSVKKQGYYYILVFGFLILFDVWISNFVHNKLLNLAQNSNHPSTQLDENTFVSYINSIVKYIFYDNFLVFLLDSVVSSSLKKRFFHEPVAMANNQTNMILLNQNMTTNNNITKASIDFNSRYLAESDFLNEFYLKNQSWCGILILVFTFSIAISFLSKTFHHNMYVIEQNRENKITTKSTLNSKSVEYPLYCLYLKRLFEIMIIGISIYIQIDYGWKLVYLNSNWHIYHYNWLLVIPLIVMNIELPIFHEFLNFYLAQRPYVFPIYHNHGIYLRQFEQDKYKDFNLLLNRKCWLCLTRLQERFHTQRAEFLNHNVKSTSLDNKSQNLESKDSGINKNKFTFYLYCCEECDHVSCTKCFDNRDKSQTKQDFLIRGDKGLKAELNNSNNYTTLKVTFRIIKLCVREVKLFIPAFILMFSSSIIHSLVPRYQNLILYHARRYEVDEFYNSCSSYITYFILQHTLSSQYITTFKLLAVKVGSKLRSDLFTSIIHSDTAFSDGYSVNELYARLNTDISSVMQPFDHALPNLISNIFRAISFAIICLYYNFYLSIFFVIVVRSVRSIHSLIDKYKRILTKTVAMLANRLKGHTWHTVSGLKSVKALGFGTEEIENSKVIQSQLSKLEMLVAVITGVIQSFVDTLYGSNIILFSFIAGTQAMAAGSVQETEAIIMRTTGFQLYWYQLTAAYYALLGVRYHLTVAGIAAKKIFPIIDNNPDLTKQPITSDLILDNNNEQSLNEIDHKEESSLVSPKIKKGFIQFRNVHFKYQQRADMVLRGIDLDIPAGSTCAIVGTSGSGKSSIINLLQRNYDVIEGSIYIDGINIKCYNPEAYRQQLSIVSQDNTLFNSSIQENIFYGICSFKQYSTMSSEDIELIEFASRCACAHHFISNLEDGYSTKAGPNGNKLSGGQKQRVLLARAIIRYKTSKLWLLDEFSSALDSETEAKVQKNIDKIVKEEGATVIIVAHRLSTIMNADLIVVLEQGKIVEQGKHKELMEKNGAYANLVQKQLAK